MLPAAPAHHADDTQARQQHGGGVGFGNRRHGSDGRGVNPEPEVVHGQVVVIVVVEGEADGVDRHAGGDRHEA